MAVFLDAPQDLYAPLLDQAYQRRIAAAKSIMGAVQNAPNSMSKAALAAKLIGGAASGLIEGIADRQARAQQSQFFDALKGSSGAGLDALTKALQAGTSIPGYDGSGGDLAGAGGAPSPSLADLGIGGISGASSDKAMPLFQQAIGSIESSNNYGAVNPDTGALGRYQVMPSNLPQWSKMALGREVSKDEFLQNKDVQDAIFSDQWARNLAKYGSPQDAASVWFTGRPINAQSQRAMDANKTTGAGYVNKFNMALARAMGGQVPQGPQPTQVASLDPGVGLPQPPEGPVAGTPFPQMAQAAPDIGGGAPMVAPVAPNLQPVPQAPPPQALTRTVPPVPQPPQGLNPMAMVPNFQERAAGIRQMLSSPNPNVAMQGYRMYQQLEQEAVAAIRAAQQQQAEIGKFNYEHGITRREQLQDANVAAQAEAAKTQQSQAFQKETAATLANTQAQAAAQQENYLRGRPTENQKEYAGARGIPGYEDFLFKLKKAGSSNVTVDQRAQSAEETLRGQAIGTPLKGFVEDGMTAAQDNVTMRRLESLLNTTETGARANLLEGLRQATGGFINLNKDSDNVQAISSMIDYLTPHMRQGLPGSASNLDVSMFRNSLPVLMNTPGGNKIIMDTLQGLNQFRIDRGNIALQWAAGDMSGKDALQAIRDMAAKADPFTELKAFNAQRKLQNGSGRQWTDPPTIDQLNEEMKRRGLK